MIKLTEVWPQEDIDALKAIGAQEIICPICGNETMDTWTICPHCNWEYDHSIGYSDANRSYKWWYRLKYRLKKVFSR